MHQNALGGRTPPAPTVKLTYSAPPDQLVELWGKGEEGRGKGKKWKGGMVEKEGRRGKGRRNRGWGYSPLKMEACTGVCIYSTCVCGIV